MRNGKSGICQINTIGLFGNIIKDLCLNQTNKTFLEIGTWNGLDSTKCFVDSLSSLNDKYLFYSLECNKDKSNFARNLYKSHKNIHILIEFIWNKEPEFFFRCI